MVKKKTFKVRVISYTKKSWGFFMILNIKNSSYYRFNIVIKNIYNLIFISKDFIKFSFETWKLPKYRWKLSTQGLPRLFKPR